MFSYSILFIFLFLNLLIFEKAGHVVPGKEPLLQLLRVCQIHPARSSNEQKLNLKIVNTQKVEIVKVESHSVNYFLMAFVYFRWLIIFKETDYCRSVINVIVT